VPLWNELDHLAWHRPQSCFVAGPAARSLLLRYSGDPERKPPVGVAGSASRRPDLRERSTEGAPAAPSAVVTIDGRGAERSTA
jgi:hypothetical protein